jgi:hypothetical protein
MEIKWKDTFKIFFTSMLVDREKEWDNCKMEIVIKKGEK